MEKLFEEVYKEAHLVETKFNAKTCMIHAELSAKTYNFTNI